MSAENYRAMTYLGRTGYALRHGYPAYAARGTGAILGFSLATALAVGVGVPLIAVAVSLMKSGKKQKSQ